MRTLAVVLITVFAVLVALVVLAACFVLITILRAMFTKGRGK